MNTLKIIVFFIFFSHINTLFSQKNNIIPTPVEQTINSGYMEIQYSPEIIADFELNSAATLFKYSVKKLELANNKQTKNQRPSIEVAADWKSSQTKDQGKASDVYA